MADIEDEPTLEALADRIRALGIQNVTTAHPHGPGDITETVWSAPRSSLDLDWYKLVARFGFDWMEQLRTLLSQPEICNDPNCMLVGAHPRDQWCPRIAL